MVLTNFLHDRPDLTHLFLNFGWDFEEEAVQTAVEGLPYRVLVDHEYGGSTVELLQSVGIPSKDHYNLYTVRQP
jgi:hypothetical protein